MRRARAARERVPALATPPRARIVVAAALFVVAAGFAWYQLDALTGAQVPLAFRDSEVYLQTAGQPFSLAHLYYPKPLLVPVVFRAAGGKNDTIVRLQKELSFAAWGALGLTLAACLRRWRAKTVAVVLCLAFLLAPLRVGLMYTILSDSISDSLLAMVVAAAIGLATAASRSAPGPGRARACGALAAVLGLLGVAWIFTRDTNAVTVLAAIPVAVALSSMHRRARRDSRAVALIVVLAAAAAFSIWSTQVVPRQPTGLSLNREWAPEITARGSFPLVNNIFIRILPDEGARAYFQEHGMPWGPDVQAFAGNVAGQRGEIFLRDPAFHAARAWIVEHGGAVYTCWLLLHPLRYGYELATQLWRVPTPKEIASYMPRGWRGGDRNPVLATLRALTTSHVALGLLLLLAPVLLWRPRQSVLFGVALCLIVSGVVGAAAGHYGDAIETARHVWGAWQQIVLGLYLAVVARLDERATAAAPVAAL